MSSWVWGVDPSTVRLAVGLAGADGLEVRSTDFTRMEPRTGERLRAVHDETFGIAFRLRREFPPCAIFVEQPFAYGRHVEPELFYAVGVIQAALAPFAPVQTVAVSTWKKRSVGKGTATKLDVFRWAEQHGYRGNSQDEADALAIAWAGRYVLKPAHDQLGLAA